MLAYGVVCCYVTRPNQIAALEYVSRTNQIVVFWQLVVIRVFKIQRINVRFGESDHHFDWEIPAFLCF